MGTHLYFASGSSGKLFEVNFNNWDWVDRPLNILVAYPFVPSWRSMKGNQNGTFQPARTMLDSGAYSAWKSGLTIDFEGLCQEAKDGGWNEVVALDVIGDGEKSLANALEMKSRGLTVIPVFHFAEPWDILAEYKKHFERIGLSGSGAPRNPYQKWLEQCFARAYPAKFHGFGLATKSIMFKFPFYTVDTASWASTVRFGRTLTHPKLRIPRQREIGDEGYDVRFEILTYLRVEKEVQERWRAEFNKNGWD